MTDIIHTNIHIQRKLRQIIIMINGNQFWIIMRDLFQHEVVSLTYVMQNVIATTSKILCDFFNILLPNFDPLNLKQKLYLTFRCQVNVVIGCIQHNHVYNLLKLTRGFILKTNAYKMFTISFVQNQLSSIKFVFLNSFHNVIALFFIRLFPFHPSPQYIQQNSSGSKMFMIQDQHQCTYTFRIHNFLA